MRIIIYILVFLTYGQFYSQEKVIDSSSIVFKAKLLTLSRTGVADSISILNNVLSQDVHFIPNRSENIMLLRIKFDQEFYIGNSNSSKGWFGSCYFYLAYNDITKKFYRLGGFDTEDIDDFFTDLQTSSSKLDTYDFLFNESFGRVIYEDVDISCLEEYHKMKPKQRKKKGFTCFEKCSEVIYSRFTTHKGFD